MRRAIRPICSRCSDLRLIHSTECQSTHANARNGRTAAEHGPRPDKRQAPSVRSPLRTLSHRCAVSLPRPLSPSLFLLVRRRWILDQSRIAYAAAAADSIKLIVWDLLRNVEVQRHIFPESVANRYTAFLNDLVLDLPRGFADITDSGLPVPGSSEVVGGLVVFDIYANSSRRVLNASVSTQPGSGFSFQVNGTDVNPGAPIAVGADGIALTPDGLFLFWTALTSRDLWRIPTCVLRDATLSDEAVNASVVHVLLKPGASDGMAFADTMGAPASVSRPSPNNTCTAADLVGAGSYQLLATDIEHATLWSFTGDLTRASVGGSITITPVSLVSDPATMLWPDSIGFSNDGALLFTSNHLNAFNTGSLDYSRVNFRVLLAQPDSPSAPLYSYISLAPDSDTFFFFTGAGAGDAPCIGNPFGIHTVSSSAPDQCLYTPNDRNSFKMQCSFNSSSGGNATAHFAAYPGPSCEGAPSLGSGSILADGRSCTSLGGSYSAYASCHQERTRAAPAPANGLDTFVWAGYTTNCSLRESVAVHYTQSGVCLLTANDGFSLISTCDDQTGASSVQLFGSPDCAAATQFAQGAGPGDGVTCLELNSLGANPQRIGSYTTACHMRDRLSAAIRISGIGGLSWIALVAAPLAALMLGARS